MSIIHQGLNLRVGDHLATLAIELLARHRYSRVRKVVKNVWWFRKGRDALTPRYDRQFELSPAPSFDAITHHNPPPELPRHPLWIQVDDRQLQQGFPS